MLQQLRGNRGGGVFLCFGGLTGIQEHQRNPVVSYYAGHLFGIDELRGAFFQLLDVFRVLKTQRAQANFRVIHAVAVKMHHVERLLLFHGTLQGFLQRGEGGRCQHGE